eukprot:1928614-Lingulodinium_polyedra.AAC.1
MQLSLATPLAVLGGLTKSLALCSALTGSSPTRYWLLATAPALAAGNKGLSTTIAGKNAHAHSSSLL